jgi:mannobiose 2-epimerase
MFLFLAVRFLSASDISIQVEIIDDLLNNILPFWVKYSRDEKRGGFYGAVGYNGSPNLTASKGLVLNARILWGFSTAYRVLGDQIYEEYADRARQYLQDYFYDTEYGGYYWMLDTSGTPTTTTKMTYGNAFVIYGLSEHYRATGDAVSLQRAIAQYETFESKIYDRKYRGYVEDFDRDWSELFRIPEATVKSTNTQIHVLESYVNLHRSWKNATLEASIYKLIDVFLNDILDRSTWHQKMNMMMNWYVTEPTFSYGHDIEIAWLLLEAAEELENQTLIAQLKEIAVHLVDVQIAEGFDKNGALTYEKQPDFFDDNLEWWPQAEAMNAFFNIYQFTKNETYIDKAQVLWNWIKKNMIDYEFGEWIRTVRANGTVESKFDKIDEWKCPYHNVRMGIQAYQRLSPRG